MQRLGTLIGFHADESAFPSIDEVCGEVFGLAALWECVLLFCFQERGHDSALPRRKAAAEKALQAGAMVGDFEAEIPHQASATGSVRIVGCDECLEVPAKPFERRDLRLTEDLLQFFCFAIYIELQDCFAEGLFAGEVVVEGAFRDVGCFEDLLQSRGCIALKADSLKTDFNEMVASA